MNEGGEPPAPPAATLVGDRAWPGLSHRVRLSAGPMINSAKSGTGPSIRQCRSRVSLTLNPGYESTASSSEVAALLLHGKDVYRASLRHVRIFSGKQQVQHSLHASRVHAPTGLDRDVLLTVHRERYRHAVDA